ncbi:pirin family protein [Nissabacter sp. SGAir0207]|uniref:pirin family protein n=1 Tax=Nissabacter sp. SGAir0207 TaxID=2126321 RepID=UPI0010CD4A4A|nr:pirin family protein [Nissabacter sp. SGAir0207]QCR37326.1 pirin family protein [Nissabacter sp. SGAir0207]
MITCRTAKQCGKADFGWLKARYTFSFGHYFDPSLMGYASLRVLNQEVLAPGAGLQPRGYPRVDVLNVILQGEAEYRDSLGNCLRAKAGEVLLLSAQPGITYSEQNPGTRPLTRMQLWLDACPARVNDAAQQLTLRHRPCQLLASPDGAQGSLQLRQQAWVHHIDLAAGERHTLRLHGPRAYLQSIHGEVQAIGHDGQARQRLACGDGAFICEEPELTIVADSPLRALLIDLAE